MQHTHYPSILYQYYLLAHWQKAIHLNPYKVLPHADWVQYAASSASNLLAIEHAYLAAIHPKHLAGFQVQLAPQILLPNLTSICSRLNFVTCYCYTYIFVYALFSCVLEYILFITIIYY